MVWSFVICALAPVTLKFDGGNDQALVQALAAQTGKSVWTVVDPDRTWPKFEATYDPEKDDLAQVVGYQLACNVVERGPALVLRPAWNTTYLSQQNRSSYELFIENRLLRNIVPRERAEVKDARVHFQPKGLPHPLYRVAPTGGAKQLRWHWYFEGAWIAIDGPGLNEADYQTALAAALGGVLQDSDQSVRIDLDGDEFKRRSILTYQSVADKRQPHDLLSPEDALYSGAVFLALSSERLKQAFHSPWDTTKLEDLSNDPRVQASARMRLSAKYKIHFDGDKVDDQSLPPHLAGKFNFAAGIVPEIYPTTGSVACRVTSIDGKEVAVL